MEPEHSSLERRVGQLAETVGALSRKIEELGDRLDAISSRRPIESVGAAVAEEKAGVLQEAPAWPDVERTGVLSGIASVCFLLVVALILRTITENGILDLQQGSFVGMGYAVAIMACGWALVSRKRRTGPVFAVSGTVLIVFMVLETHQRFRVLPTEAAFPVLLAVTAGMGCLGLRREMPLLLAVTVLGTSTAAVYLGIRGASTLWVAAVLLVSNVLAYKASRVSWGAALRWFVFALTVLYGIERVLQGRAPTPEGVDPESAKLHAWLPAMACVFTMTFAYLVVRRAGRKRTALGAFDAVVVVVSILGTYEAAMAVFNPTPGAAAWLPPVALGSAAALVGLSAWLARGGLGGNLAAGTFCAAGSSLWLVAALDAVGGNVAGLGLWAAAALVPALLAIRLGPVFLWTACAAEGAVALLAAFGGSMAVPSAAPGTTMVALVLLAALGLLHHFWLRRRPEQGLGDGEPSFSPTAMIPLTASLGLLFGGARLLLHEILSASGPVDAGTFACAQSVVINLGAAGLALVACIGRSKDIFAVAVVVGCLGATKVFAFDLLGGKGIPLVLSVFSVGLATTIGSLALRRLPGRRRPPAPDGAIPSRPAG